MTRKFEDSKAPWAPIIPVGWKAIRNKFLLIGSYSGGTPAATNPRFYNDEGIPFISIADMSNVDYVEKTEKHVTEAGMTDKNLQIVPRGSVIYSMYATVGHVAETKIDATISQAMIALYLSEKYDKAYYKYSLQAIRDYIFGSAEGTTQMNLNAQKVYEMFLLQPPIPEQQSIVSYLDQKCATIDEAIARHGQIIEKLEEFKRSQIIALVYGKNQNEAKKPSGIGWVPEIPMLWDVVPMRFAFFERDSKNSDLNEQNLLTLSYGKIKRKNINSGDGLLPKSFNTYNIIEKGDTVLRLLDLQNDKHSLRTGLVTERGIITSAYVTVHPHESFDPVYARYVLHAYDLMKVFYTMGEGVRQGLTYDEVSRTLLIPKPPMEIQKAIVNSIISMEDRVDGSIQMHKTMIEKLEEYRKSIIYNAVTGKIDCREVV